MTAASFLRCRVITTSDGTGGGGWAAEEPLLR